MSVNAEMRWRAETQIHLLLQESVQTPSFFGPWNCFSHLVKAVQLWCFPSYFFSESHVGISACSKSFLSSQLQPYKGSPERLQICIWDSIRTCILICHTRTPGTGRRERPLLLQVGYSHLGAGAADVAQRTMLAQSQYWDSYQPAGLDKWQPHFPGTLKEQKAI